MLAFLLVGCAAQRAYNDGVDLIEEGKVEEGLVQMDRASRLDPDNSEYRAQYFKRRETVVYQWLLLAEAAKNNGVWNDAEGYYRRILKIDPDNPRAKTGLSSLDTQRKLAQLLKEAQSLLENNDLLGASKNVRLVLAESPSQPQALKLRKMIEANAAASNQSGTILKSKLTHPITIEFKDAPIQAVFNVISKTAGVNFIFDKEVRSDQRVTMMVRDVRIEDVIRFVLVTNQLEQRILNGNTLFIYPNTPQKQRDFRELQVKSFYLTNANAKDVAAMLKGMVKTGDIYVDDKLNRIVMRETPDAIRVAERLVAAQDIAEPEVMLDVEVLEVGTNKLDTIGIQYPSQLGFSAVGAAGTPGKVTLREALNRNAGLVNVSISDPALILNLLHQDGDTNLLANPKIRVKNHEKANIHIGDKVPVITNTTTSTGLVSQSVNYIDVGLKLDVEPTVYLDNDVGIKIGLEVSNIVKQIPNANGSLAYQIGTRNASTILRIKDGETQMLAGLINREDRKNTSSVPWLGKLPILGSLFSSHSDSASKTEVVLLITPHVVRNIVNPEAPIEEFTSGTETLLSLERIELSPAEEKKSESSAAKGDKPALPSSNNKSDVASPVSPEVSSADSFAIKGVQFFLDSPARVQAGKEFSIKVSMTGSGVQNAYIDFSFDPSKFKVGNVIEGDLSKSTSGKTKFMYQAQDDTGRINIGMTGDAEMQDNGVIATIILQPLTSASGNAGFRIGAANLTGKAGKTLPINNLPSVTLEVVK